MKTDYLPKERVKWIDLAKFLAILAVMVDHTGGILYSSYYVAYSSYFSVSLFIIVLGITTMWQLCSADNVLKKSWTMCTVILRPYIVATVIYRIFITGFFDFEDILNSIVYFNGTLPFYWVLLYLQLVLISPVIMMFLEHSSGCRIQGLIEMAGLIATMVVSWMTTNYSDILGVYGGGGKLFGGTYLVLFYIGMWFAKYFHKIRIGIASAVICSLIMFACTIAWWIFISNNRLGIDSRLPFGEGFNPPSISFGIYALLIASMLLFLERALSCRPNGFLMKIMTRLSSLGKHTMYIFLYHMFFLSIVLPRVESVTGIVIENIWIKRFGYFGIMIFGSIIIEVVLEKAHRIVLKIYNNRDDECKSTNT